MYVAKDSPHVKLIDFGFAARLHGKAVQLQESCGSLQYIAPEIIKKFYTEKVDVWSIGSTVYTMLTGQPLFRGSEQEVLRKTAAGRPDFSDRFGLLSGSARDFIASLLTVNPEKRLSASEAVTHTWLSFDEVAAATKAVAIATDGHCILLQKVRKYLGLPQPQQTRLLALVTWSLPAESEFELCCCFNALSDATRGVITSASLRSSAAGSARRGGSNAEEEVLLINEVAKLLEEASSNSQYAAQELGWSQLLAASLISEQVKLSEEEANLQTSVAPEVVEVVVSCKVDHSCSSDSGEQIGGSTRTDSLVGAIMPCPSCPSLLEPTEPTLDESSGKINPRYVDMVVVDYFSFHRQLWAGCWSPLKKFFNGR